MTPRRQRIRKKIMQRVVVIDCGHVTPCFVWTGPDSGKNGRGYGYPRMSLDGATVAVHIALWVNENGMVPPRKQLDHKCCNRPCVCPDHLEMVTHRKNQRRRAKQRGRL